MARKEIKGPINDNTLNNTNHNFKELYDEFDNVVQEVSDKALHKVIDASKLNWKEPVASVSNFPKTASEGDTIMTRDTGKVYRYNGKEFVEIQQIDASPVNEVDSRLTSQLAETMKEFNLRNNQTDYVQLLKRHNNFTDMQLHKINNDQFEISVFDENKHMTYQFMYNNDDYIVQTRVWTGAIKPSSSPYKEDKFSATNHTGSGWVIGGSDSVASYTENIGDKYSYEFSSETGDVLSIDQRFHPTGGMWEFTLDNSQTKKLSIFSEEPENKVVELFRNLQRGTHTLIAEYLGQDPSNPLGSPRGWTQEERRNFLLVGKPTIEVNKDITLTEPSNKEFAFYIKPEGGSEFQFVPFHGDKTSFFASQPKIKDGNRVIDLASLDYFETIPINSFSLAQHIYGRHPESGSTNLLEIWTTSIVDKGTGLLSFDGKMEVLEPVTFNNSYVIMGTAKGDIFDRLLTSFKNQVVADSTTYGQGFPLKKERDWAKSYLFLSREKKELAIAFRFNNIKETLREGEFGKDSNPDNMTYLQNRDDKVKKVYSRLFNTALVERGYQIRFSGDYIFCNSDNFFDLMSL